MVAGHFAVVAGQLVKELVASVDVHMYLVVDRR